MENINQNLQKINALLQDGRYETAEPIVTKLQTVLTNNEDNLNMMHFNELRSLYKEIDKLAKLAESLYSKEQAKIRTKRIARMLYAYQDLPEWKFFLRVIYAISYEAI